MPPQLPLSAYSAAFGPRDVQIHRDLVASQFQSASKLARVLQEVAAVVAEELVLGLPAPVLWPLRRYRSCELWSSDAFWVSQFVGRQHHKPLLH